LELFPWCPSFLKETLDRMCSRRQLVHNLTNAPVKVHAIGDGVDVVVMLGLPSARVLYAARTHDPPPHSYPHAHSHADDPLARVARTTRPASNRLTWLFCYSCLRPSSTWQTPTQGHTPAHAHMLGTPATDTNTNAATDDRPQSNGLDAHTLVEQEHSRWPVGVPEVRTHAQQRASASSSTGKAPWRTSLPRWRRWWTSRKQSRKRQRPHG
jgi:hypothetical protein